VIANQLTLAGNNGSGIVINANGQPAIGSGGSSIIAVRTSTASLNFPSIAANGGVQELTITVTGAAVGDTVQINSAAGATMPTAGLAFYTQVTSANTVTVRATNVTTSAIDPVDTLFRVTVTTF
jgi:hypothetical protein